MKPLAAILFLVVLVITSCHKKSNNSPPITGGGKGGNVTIKVTPEAYNLFVDTCTIYIHYGSTDAPANGVYDDSAVCDTAGGKPIATFTGLTEGLYYFYGVGYHSGYSHPPNVSGAQKVTVFSSNTDTSVYLPTYSYIP